MEASTVDLGRIQGFIVVCGNDGAGKTSTARILNEHFDKGSTNLYAFERSTKPTEARLIELKTAISPKAIDDITFIYTFEERPEICWKVQHNGKQLPVYWIMLDVEIAEIERRIHSRLEQTIYEVRKCIQYYQRVYRELAAFYGIPLVPTDGIKPAEVALKVLELIQKNHYEGIHNLAFRSFSQELVQQHDLQGLIEKEVTEGRTVVEVLPKSLTDELLADGVFGKELQEPLSKDITLKAKLLAKWLIDKGVIVHDKDDVFTVTRESVTVQVRTPWALQLIVEGESKKLYRIILPHNNDYFKGQVIILLKSTIYSHTNQHTGVIKDLAKVRAVGSSIFVDLMMRNDLQHAYRCITPDGTILSDFKDITPVEIVFKKYCVGTDKHSYFGLDSPAYSEKIVQQDNNGMYSSGVYIRFDWRNPNHTSCLTKTALADNPYYYTMEEYIGKNTFFQNYIRDLSKCKPFGDKCIYPELISSICKLGKIRKNLVKLYCTLKHYMGKVGLELIDGCFMMDKSGEVFWSEINPDCMRIRANSMDVKYDKDIWRAGGSSSKDEIIKKWTLLNELLMEYLKKNRFHETELHQYNSLPHQLEAEIILNQKDINLTEEYRNIYRQLVRPEKRKRRFIATIDMHNGKPALVKSSEVFDSHSNGDVEEAFSKLTRYFDEVLMVDLNGSMKDSKEGSQANRDLIKKCNSKYRVMAGGGIHTIADVEELLSAGVKKIVVGSNTSKEFLDQIPKERLIVELSINDEFEVLIEGRKVNTKVKAITKVLQLVALGVQAFSFTFVKSQGHLNGLDRPALRKLLVEIPRFVNTIIIAGGITSIDDLKFLWSFDRVVPQLGSAIWKNKISAGEIISEAANYDEHELLPTVINTTTGKVKGLVYLNRQALLKSCQSGQLWRYSREHKRLMLKGETSGDFQAIEHLSLDCDGDSLLVTVNDEHNFCHNGTFSCFGQ